MNIKNEFYLFLTKDREKLENFIEVLEEEEQKNEKLKFCVLFNTVDRLASEISRDTGYPEKVVHACVALSYQDVYDLTELVTRYLNE